MNIENLELKTYKNYKELCGTLEEPIKGGKSKQLQMKDFERYFEFHKEGNKIVIDKIFSEEREKIDMRKSDYISETDKRHNGNNTFYGEDIEKLLLLMMASTTFEDELIFPMSIILNKISMVNSNYSIGRRNQERLSELLKIDEKYVNEFYDTTHSNLRSTLESALNRLDRKSLLRWKTVRMICKKVAIVKYNELDEIEIDMDTDKVQYTIQEEYEIATKEQDLIIIDAENKILEEIRVKLNQKVKEKTLDNAIKRQEKTTKEVITKGYGKKRKKDKQNLRLSDTYLDNIQLLIDTVIDIKAKSIRKQLKEKIVTK